MQRTQIFTDTAVYFGGEPTPQIAAYNVVMDQPNAVDLFDDIRRNGGTVGRLYALCAYQLLDKERHQSLLSELRANEYSVYTQFGCTGGSEHIHSVVDEIENNNVGKFYRQARDGTYAQIGKADNLCARLR